MGCGKNYIRNNPLLDHLTEQTEKYIPFPNVPRTEPLKRDAELKLEGHIECQPEYRKAYIDYLIRERVERKSRPLDNLGQVPTRAVDQEPVFKSTLVTVQPPSEEKPPSAKPDPPPKSAKPTPGRSARNRSLSQIESSVFGPKLTVPDKKKSSRSSSPESVASKSSRRRSRTLPRSQKVANASDSDGSARPQKDQTFGKRVLVENLASRSTTPVPPLIDISARNKWMKDSSVESNAAFVVLDKNVKSAYNQRCRDNWTPFWNSSSSDY